MPPSRARLEGAAGQSLKTSEKAVVAERPADAFRGAQAGEQFRFGLAGKQIGEAGEAIPDRRQRRQTITLPRKCARVLDQRQSCARSTSLARTGLSDT
jgi:hypothetical protein